MNIKLTGVCTIMALALSLAPPCFAQLNGSYSGNAHGDDTGGGHVYTMLNTFNFSANHLQGMTALIGVPRFSGGGYNTNCFYVTTKGSNPYNLLGAAFIDGPPETNMTMVPAGCADGLTWPVHPAVPVSHLA